MQYGNSILLNKAGQGLNLWCPNMKGIMSSSLSTFIKCILHSNTSLKIHITTLQKLTEIIKVLENEKLLVMVFPVLYSQFKQSLNGRFPHKQTVSIYIQYLTFSLLQYHMLTAPKESLFRNFIQTNMCFLFLWFLFFTFF